MLKLSSLLGKRRNKRLATKVGSCSSLGVVLVTMLGLCATLNTAEAARIQAGLEKAPAMSQIQQTVFPGSNNRALVLVLSQLPYIDDSKGLWSRGSDGYIVYQAPIRTESFISWGVGFLPPEQQDAIHIALDKQGYQTHLELIFDTTTTPALLKGAHIIYKGETPYTSTDEQKSLFVNILQGTPLSGAQVSAQACADFAYSTYKTLLSINMNKVQDSAQISDRLALSMKVDGLSDAQLRDGFGPVIDNHINSIASDDDALTLTLTVTSKLTDISEAYCNELGQTLYEPGKIWGNFVPDYSTWENKLSSYKNHQVLATVQDTATINFNRLLANPAQGTPTKGYTIAQLIDPYNDARGWDRWISYPSGPLSSALIGLPHAPYINLYLDHNGNLSYKFDPDWAGIPAVMSYLQKQNQIAVDTKAALDTLAAQEGPLSPNSAPQLITKRYYDAAALRLKNSAAATAGTSSSSTDATASASTTAAASDIAATTSSNSSDGSAHSNNTAGGHGAAATTPTQTKHTNTRNHSNSNL